jgi:vitamin B12 transporter
MRVRTVAYSVILVTQFLNLWGLCVPAYGQTDTSTYQLLGIEITALPMNRSRDRTAETLSIKSDSLGRFLAGSLTADGVLSQVEGLYLRNYGGHGGVKTVSFRGFAANQTNFSINGVPYEQPSLGTVNAGNFLLQGLSSMDVTANPLTLLQNPGGGQVDLRFGIERSAGRARVGVGTFGEYFQSAGYGHKWKRGTVGGQLQYTAAQDNYPYNLNNEKGLRQNADYGHLQWQVGGSWQIDKAGRHQIAYNQLGYDTRSLVPPPIVAGNPDNGGVERLLQQSVFHFLRYEGQMDAKQRFKLVLTLKHHHDYTRYTRAKTYNRYLTENAFAAAEASHVSKFNRLSLAVNAQLTDLRSNNLATANDTLPSITRNELGFSLSDRVSIPLKRGTKQQISLAAYARVNVVQRFLPQWNAAAHLAFRPDRKGRWEFYGHLTRSVRLPAFNELYYNGYGNSRLKPEATSAVDAGLRFVLEKPVFFTGKAAFFANQTENKIVTVPLSPVRWSTLQLGKTETMGAELALELDWRDYIQVWYTYTWMQARDRTVTGGKLLPYTPQEIIGGGITGRWRGLCLSLQGQYVSFRYSNLENDRLSYLPPYFLLDVVANYTHRIGKIAVEVGIIAQNVTGQRYVVIQSYPMPWQTFRFECGVHW